MRSPYTTSHRFQSTAYQPNTHVVHIALTGMQQCCCALPAHTPNVSFILISSSPDFDVLNQQRVVVMTKFFRMLSGKRDRERFQVRCSDLVGCSTKCCICQKSQGSAMSRLRCHDLREAISDLLTVTMHLQDAVSRFHRPGLHKIDLGVHVASASTRTLAFHKSQSCPCAEQSSQVSSCTSCSIGLSLRYPRKLHRPVLSTRTHQNSDKPCSVSSKTHTRDTTCFQQNP